VEGAAAQTRIDALRQQRAAQQAEIHSLPVRLKHAVEITSDRPHALATVAQAEGVGLSVARRLLQVVEGGNPRRVCPPWGGRLVSPARAPGPCSRCSTRRPGPRSKRPPPTRLFGPRTGPDGRRARKPLLEGRSPGQSPRWRHPGRGIRPTSRTHVGGPRRRHRARPRAETRAGPPSPPRPSRP
jgi:hypothetical protein